MGSVRICWSGVMAGGMVWVGLLLVMAAERRGRSA